MTITENPLNMTRQEKWHYIIDTFLGGLSDEGILIWFANAYESAMTLDEMFEDAIKHRGGQIAT